MNKNQIWAQLKAFGNPEGFTWDTPKIRMAELLKQIRSELDFIELANVATGFVEDQEERNRPQEEPIMLDDEEIEIDEDEGEPDAFEEYDILQEIIEEEAEKLNELDFAIEWRYTTLKKKKVKKYLARTQQILQNQIDALKNKSSDFDGRTPIVKGSFQIIKQFDQYVPEKKKRVRSKRGQGNDFLNCEIIDDEYIYCPASGRCLIDCLTKNVKDFGIETLAPLLK